MESGKIGKKIVQGLRKLGIIEEPWMVVRRRMQALNAFCAVHERTSARFERLLLDSKRKMRKKRMAAKVRGRTIKILAAELRTRFRSLLDAKLHSFVG